MSPTERTVRAGIVGRPHGLAGGFYLSAPAEPLAVGDAVRVGSLETTVAALGGTAARPIVRLAGVTTRDEAVALRGEPLRVAAGELEPGEYFAADLVGLRVSGLGAVRRVVSGPSCDVLEVGDDGVLVPFVRDAVKRVDTAAGTIEVDLGFLGLK